MGQNMKSLFADKQAVLLDVDGTLVHSNELHASAWAEALERFGYEIAAEQVRPLIGKGGDKLLPELTGVEAESPEGRRIVEARTRIFVEHYAPRIKPNHKARELLDFLRRTGRTLVIATSASDEELKAILKAAELDECFDERTSSDDAEASKPDPDIITAALKKLGMAKDSALMLGDTPYDLEAARRAGVDMIGFRCGGWSDQDFEGAAAICEGPEELLTELCRLPESSALQPTPPSAQSEAGL